MLRSALIAMFLALATGCAQAACPMPFGQTDRPFFLDILASDGPLEVFCRIQRYPGPHRLNVLFMGTQVSKTFDLDFKGTGAEIPGQEFAQLLQSVLPAVKGPAKDENGVPFSRVWSRVVQGSASATPGERPWRLAMPPETAVGQAAMLWERMAIRLKPIRLADVDFTLSVEMKPDPGRLMYEVAGMPGLVVGAWKGRLALGSNFRPECSGMLPLCADLPETVPVHFAMSVSKVILEASGENISVAADAVLKKMAATTPGRFIGDDPNQFDLVRGQARYEIEDNPFLVTVEAIPGKVGVATIRVTWQQREGQGQSWGERSWKAFEAQRDALTRAQSSQRR